MGTYIILYGRLLLIFWKIERPSNYTFNLSIINPSISPSIHPYLISPPAPVTAFADLEHSNSSLFYTYIQRYKDTYIHPSIHPSLPTYLASPPAPVTAFADLEALRRDPSKFFCLLGVASCLSPFERRSTGLRIDFNASTPCVCVMNGWMEGLGMYVCTYVCMYGFMYGWMDGWTGWMDGRICLYILCRMCACMNI